MKQVAGGDTTGFGNKWPFNFSIWNFIQIGWF